MSSRKPPSNPDDWDDFDIPTWDDSTTKSPKRNPSPSQPSSTANRPTYPETASDSYDVPSNPPRQSPRLSSANQQPTRLSNRVPSRSTRPSQDPYRDPYSGFDDALAGDPYAPELQYARQEPVRPAASSQYDLYADPALDPGWGDAVPYQEAPASRRGRASRPRTRPAGPSVSIPRPTISDGPLATIVGVAALGLLLMIGVVWWGIGDIPSVIPWHLNASGDVDSWVSSSTLWRIPFGVFMSLVIGVIVGVFLWKRDRFAARFVVTSMCIVQVLAWVAVIDQLW